MTNRIIFWKYYNVDLKQVAAVGPATTHADVIRQITEAFFLIYLCGGGHIRVDYSSIKAAKQNRGTFVVLWREFIQCTE